jgi:hypothetical protein
MLLMAVADALETWAIDRAFPGARSHLWASSSLALPLEVPIPGVPCRRFFRVSSARH